MSWSRTVVCVAVLAVATPLVGQQSPGRASASSKPAAATDAGSPKYFRLHWAQLVDQYGFAQPRRLQRDFRGIPTAQPEILHHEFLRRSGHEE